MIVGTIIVYFAVLMLLSRWTARRSDNDTFYRGNRQSKWYLVAFGMVGASISGVTFISVPGMVLKMDMTYIQTCLGFILGYAAVALPLEHDHHLLLPATTVGKQGAQNGCELLPAVEDDGCGSTLLCGMYPVAPLRSNSFVAGLHLFCCYRSCDDRPDMALYASWRYQDTGVDRYVSDHLYVHSPAADYLAGNGGFGDECGRGGASHCGRYP